MTLMLKDGGDDLWLAVYRIYFGKITFENFLIRRLKSGMRLFKWPFDVFNLMRVIASRSNLI